MMRRATAASFAHACPRTSHPLLRAISVVLRVLRGKSLTVMKTEPEWKFSPPNDHSCPIATRPLRQAFPRRTRNAGAVGSRLWGLVLAICGLMLSNPAHAADLPEFTPPPDQRATALANPAELLATMASQLDQNADTVVVTVQSLPVTQHDVANVIRSLPVSLASMGMRDVYRHAMDILIRQKVMVLKARELGLDKDPAVIDQGKLAFDKVLADAWLARKSDAAITDAALHAAYDRIYAGKPGPDEVRARVIMVTTDAEARTVIEKFQNGADFSELARQFSKDPSAQNGGDLGFLPLEAMAPEVGSVVFALSPGQVTQYPVRALFGYFVLRVESRRQRATPSFDEVRLQLERDLRAVAVRDAITSLLNEIKFAPGAKPALLPD
jgi:peptidyl-prolyl cis-trans isomerase C